MCRFSAQNVIYLHLTKDQDLFSSPVLAMVERIERRCVREAAGHREAGEEVEREMEAEMCPGSEKPRKGPLLGLHGLDALLE